ncbi:MAG: hypothetical protein FJW20_08125 [Acidimicrobiia bacterium]|nr:hypothetical protein [Acidimicrobiia bacterium]
MLRWQAAAALPTAAINQQSLRRVIYQRLHEPRGQLDQHPPVRLRFRLHALPRNSARHAEWRILFAPRLPEQTQTHLARHRFASRVQQKRGGVHFPSRRHRDAKPRQQQLLHTRGRRAFQHRASRASRAC